jgi:hypothetical protein
LEKKKMMKCTTYTQTKKMRRSTNKGAIERNERRRRKTCKRLNRKRLNPNKKRK